MKAIALVSGGLDSVLAASVVGQQGIDIVPVIFKIPFHHRNKRTLDKNSYSKITENLQLEPEIVDIGIDFLKLLEGPRYGFGSNLNPCIDCKILMLTKAKELMLRRDAAFVVTGEVLGQRSMSQNRQSLGLIEKRAGLEGLLLRPLSAKLLAHTTPEREGWVDRNRLFGFSGRTRKPQIELAKTFNMKNIPGAAGGCLLTDLEFAKRLKDIIRHGGLSLDNVDLLKIGRHFRLSPTTKLVVGRNEQENLELEGAAEENDYLFFPNETMAGPTSLGRGIFSEELIRLSCSITSRYCDTNGSLEADIIYRMISRKEDKILRVKPLSDAVLNNFRL